MIYVIAFLLLLLVLANQQARDLLLATFGIALFLAFWFVVAGLGLAAIGIGIAYLKSNI